MPTRSLGQEVLRFLHTLPQPLYLIDEDRRIVFLNEACGLWLNLAAADLLGRAVSYQSSGSEPLEIAANSLCPPPEVFHGKAATATIASNLQQRSPEERRVQFIPLSSRDELSHSVLAIVDPTPMAASMRMETAGSSLSVDEARQLHKQIQLFRRDMAQVFHLDRLVGQSPAMTRVRAQVKMAAAANASVFIVGPHGSGRQHVARTIHNAQSQDGSFIPIACASVSLDSLRSALSAAARRPNHTDAGTSATLFLADVDALPAEMQLELLQWIASAPRNLRYIASAKEPPDRLLDSKILRFDLVHLLSTLVIELPPLAARREDIPLIAQLLLEDLNAQGQKQLRGFAPAALDRLMQYQWPGQIDELAGVVREAFNTTEGFEITAADLPKRLSQAAEAARFPRREPQPIDLETFLAQIETELIERALRIAKGNKTKAAQLLGLNRPRLYRRMVQLGLASDADSES